MVMNVTFYGGLTSFHRCNLVGDLNFTTTLDISRIDISF